MRIFISIIDLLAFLALLLALFILINRVRFGIKRDIRIPVGILLTITLVYVFFLLLEWMNINHELQSVEDIIGASVPMMWAFVLYSFIQYNVKEVLTLSRENLRTTLNSIGDAVITADLNGRITGMNPAAETFTGWNSDEVLGRKADEIIVMLDAVSRKKIANPVGRVLETGKIVKIGGQTILVGKNNREYYISDSAAPIFNGRRELFGVVFVFSDMSERYLQEEKVRLSEERYDLAISGTKAGIWDWYIPSDKIVINERWAEIIGFSCAELEPVKPDTWLKRIHPEDLIMVEELLELNMKGKADHIEVESRLRNKNGEWIWTQVKGMVVERDKQKNPLRMTGTMVDITRQKSTEFELKNQIEENISLNEEYVAQNEELLESIERIKKINEELNEARINAEESYRLKSAFLANMSHEIRTPMNGIIGFSELLKDTKIPEDRRMHFAGIVIDSSRQLLNIVNDILDISRIETGKVSLTLEKVVINDLINVLYAFFEPQIGDKPIDLVVSKPLSNEKSTVVTDRTRLRQILTNLLNNAIKFTHEGEIRFGYNLVNNDEELEFFVSDTGIGISGELHEKIFEPFRQADLEITNTYGGTGLGLTISRKLAELLGGRIRLESDPGKGSVFYLTLPYMRDMLAKETEVKKEKKVQIKTYDMVVLIVEDDEVNYLFLETVLAKNNIKTIRAWNGIEAVALCNNNRNIRLVLMDMKLPVMNGYEATRRIKKIRPDLPVIAQTAYAMHEDRKKAIEAGCDGYISKPIITADLLKIIEETLSDKK